MYMDTVVPRFLDEDFRSHYRVSKDIFEDIVEDIVQVVTPQIVRKHGGGTEQMSPQKQVLVFLCHMSNQESMGEVGHYFGISKGTVHSTTRRVSSCLNSELGNIISWPDRNEQAEISREFQLKSGLPGIIGAVDGTHIRLSGCVKGDSDYINRKGYPSMQLQIVTDHRLLIRHAYSGWPGCTHDARVLKNSSLYQIGNQVSDNMYIIGDSAYPLFAWLLTPFKDNWRLNVRQKRFNYALSSSRQVVERCIGHIKGRFRRLREITLHHPEAIVDEIISGCILHNKCVLSDDLLERFIEPTVMFLYNALFRF